MRSWHLRPSPYGCRRSSWITRGVGEFARCSATRWTAAASTAWPAASWRRWRATGARERFLDRRLAAHGDPPPSASPRPSRRQDASQLLGGEPLVVGVAAVLEA